MRKAIVRKMQDEGVSAEQMAKAMGVSKRTWFYWLSHPTRMTVGTLQSIAYTLNMTDEETVRLWKTF